MAGFKEGALQLKERDLLLPSDVGTIKLLADTTGKLYTVNEFGVSARIGGGVSGNTYWNDILDKQYANNYTDGIISSATFIKINSKLDSVWKILKSNESLPITPEIGMIGINHRYALNSNIKTSGNGCDVAYWNVTTSGGITSGYWSFENKTFGSCIVNLDTNNIDSHISAVNTNWSESPANYPVGIYECISATNGTYYWNPVVINKYPTPDVSKNYFLIVDPSTSAYTWSNSISAIYVSSATITNLSGTSIHYTSGSFDNVTIKSFGGTSAQFVKGDGSLDSTKYWTSAYHPTTLSAYGISTEDTLFDPIYLNNSVGVIDSNAPSFLDNNNGTCTIGSCNVNLRDNTTSYGRIKTYKVSSKTFTIPADGNTYFIEINYNSGNPTYQLASNTADINDSTIVTIYSCWRVTTSIGCAYFGSNGTLLSNKINYMIDDTKPYSVSNGSSLRVSEVNRLWSITSATVYSGTTKVNVPSITASNTNMYACYHSSGSWIYTSGSSLYDNLNYDDGTNLQSLGNNKWSVRWIYRAIGNPDRIFYTLGSTSYNTSASADIEQPRTDLPKVIIDHCILVGKSIIQYNAASGITRYVISTAFSSSSVTNHNDLNGILGDTPYYHLGLSGYNLINNIEALSGSSGLLKLTSGTPSLDTNSYAIVSGTSAQFLKGDGSLDSSHYLTSNQNIILSGDVSGSGTSAINLSLSNIITSGTAGSDSIVPVITYDQKGRLTSVTSAAIQISESQVSNLTSDLNSKLNTVTAASTYLTISNPTFSGILSGPQLSATHISASSLYDSQLSNTNVLISSGGTIIDSQISNDVLMYLSGTSANIQNQFNRLTGDFSDVDDQFLPMWSSAVNGYVNSTAATVGADRGVIVATNTYANAANDEHGPGIGVQIVIPLSGGTNTARGFRFNTGLNNELRLWQGTWGNPISWVKTFEVTSGGELVLPLTMSGGKILASNSNHGISETTIPSTYLNGLSANIQDQINNNSGIVNSALSNYLPLSGGYNNKLTGDLFTKSITMLSGCFYINNTGTDNNSAYIKYNSDSNFQINSDYSRSILFTFEGSTTPTFAIGSGSITANADITTKSIYPKLGTGCAIGSSTNQYADIFVTQIGSPSAYVTDAYLGNIHGNSISTYSISTSSVVISGGTSSQFLKADGSLDSNVYITSASSISGNAATATKLATARTIALSGDGSWSVSFNGSDNVSGALTLTSLLTAGSAGSSTSVPVLTWDAKGRLTAVESAAISIPHTQISDWGTYINQALLTTSSPTFAGISTTPTYGTCGIFTGNADNASYSTYNLKIKSWWGIGFESYDNITRILFDTRTGNISTLGSISEGGTALSSKYLGINASIPSSRISDWGTYINQALLTTSSPTFANITGVGDIFASKYMDYGVVGYGYKIGTNVGTVYSSDIGQPWAFWARPFKSNGYSCQMRLGVSTRTASGSSDIDAISIDGTGATSFLQTIYANGGITGDLTGNAATASAVAWTGITSKPDGIDNRGAARLYRGDAADGYWLSHSWSSVCISYFGSNSWYLTASNSYNDQRAGIHTVLVDYAGLSVDSQQLGGVAASSYLLATTAASTYLPLGGTASNASALGGVAASSYLLASTASSTYLPLSSKQVFEANYGSGSSTSTWVKLGRYVGNGISRFSLVITGKAGWNDKNSPGQIHLFGGTNYPSAAAPYLAAGGFYYEMSGSGTVAYNIVFVNAGLGNTNAFDVYMQTDVGNWIDFMVEATVCGGCTWTTNIAWNQNAPAPATDTSTTWIPRRVLLASDNYAGYNNFTSGLSTTTLTVSGNSNITGTTDLTGGLYLRQGAFALNSAGTGWTQWYDRNGGSPIITAAGGFVGNLTGTASNAAALGGKSPSWYLPGGQYSIPANADADDYTLLYTVVFSSQYQCFNNEVYINGKYDASRYSISIRNDENTSSVYVSKFGSPINDAGHIKYVVTNTSSCHNTVKVYLVRWSWDYQTNYSFSNCTGSYDLYTENSSPTPTTTDPGVIAPTLSTFGYITSAMLVAANQFVEGNVNLSAKYLGIDASIPSSRISDWSTATSSFLTGNQSISLKGAVTGSGTTSIATSFANTHLAGINQNLATTSSPTFGQASLGTWGNGPAFAWFGAAGQNNATNGNSGFLQLTGSGHIYMSAPSGAGANIQYNGGDYVIVSADGVSMPNSSGLAVTGLITANGGISGNLTGHASLDIPLTGSSAITGALVSSNSSNIGSTADNWGTVYATGVKSTGTTSVSSFSLSGDTLTLSHADGNFTWKNAIRSSVAGLVLQNALISGTFSPEVNSPSTEYTISSSDQGKMVISINQLNLPLTGISKGFWCIISWHSGGGGAKLGPSTSGTAWYLRGSSTTVGTLQPVSGIASWDGYTWYVN